MRRSSVHDEQPPARARRRRRVRRWFRLVLFGGIALALVAVLGFVSFADGLPRNETRVASLRRKSEERRVGFAPGVLETVARLDIDNVRELLGA